MTSKVLFECHEGHQFRGDPDELFLKPCPRCAEKLEKKIESVEHKKVRFDVV